MWKRFLIAVKFVFTGELPMPEKAKREIKRYYKYSYPILFEARKNKACVSKEDAEQLLYRLLDLEREMVTYLGTPPYNEIQDQ
jgi:hypothetical protein